VSTETTITLSADSAADLPSFEIFCAMLERYTDQEVSNGSGWSDFSWNADQGQDENAAELYAQHQGRYGAEVRANLPAWSRHFPAVTITLRTEWEGEDEPGSTEYTWQAGQMVSEREAGEVDLVQIEAFQAAARAWRAEGYDEPLALAAITAAAAALGVTLS
jgi:hypothetical protein